MAKKEDAAQVPDSMMDAETLAAIEPVTELIIGEWGAYLGKHSERLKVTKKSVLLQEVPLAHLQQVLITSGGVSLSSDAIEECARRGIPIHFLDFAGRAYATLFSGQLTGTVKTRREQLLAYTDRRGLILGRTFAMGKVYNQMNLLRYMSKNHKVTEELQQTLIDLEGMSDALSRLEGENIDAVRGQLLATEGQAAKVYWAQMKQLLRVETDWPGREGQGATDLVNSLLNYGYGVLYTKVEQALVLAGLDPFAGFVHTDRPGKPSLVFDLIEEFRQPVVDRAVFAMLNLKMVFEQDEEGKLSMEARRQLAKKIMERLAEGRERYEGKRQSLQFILYSQARHIATFVRGDLGRDYEPFICSW
jgi:CRISPR-associated protein Cas1